MKSAIRVAVVLTAAALLVFFSAAAVRNWQGERFLSRARSEQRRGNIQGSRELYAEALRYGKGEAAVELARMAYNRRDWEGVRDYARQAVAINPLRGYVHVLLAYTRAAEGAVEGREGVEQVLGECRRAVSLDPTNGGLWRSCADLSLRLYVSEVLRWGDDPAMEFYREETLRAYRQAMLFSPREGAGAAAFAASLHGDGAFLVDLARGGNRATLGGVAKELIAGGMWEDARDLWMAAAAESESPREWILAAAEALRREKRGFEAFAILAGHIDSDGEDGEVMFLAAVVASSFGEKDPGFAEAGRLFARAVELVPDNPYYLRTLGGHLLRTGDGPGAEARLREALELNPRDAEGWYLLGRAGEKIGEPDEALAAYRKALALRPDNGRYRKAAEGMEGK